MQTSLIETHAMALKKLLLSAKKIGTLSLEEAANTDAVDSFPEKTLYQIKSSNLLTACIPKIYGGQDLGLKPGTNSALLSILKYIGSGNLVMGRVLEGHMNAQILINQFGTDDQIEYFAQQAFAGKLFGVWNTQANDGTVLSLQKDGSHFLDGTKTFATGTDYVSFPIVTAKLADDSWQMFAVPIDKVNAKSDASWWQPLGMRASRSFKMTFENTPIPAENLVGEPDQYYEQPGFSGGAVRFAAVQLGAAEMLLTETRNYLQNLKRTDDPYQKMRLGQMSIAVESGNQWLLGAAKQMDDYMNEPLPENSERFLAYANMMRTAIEQICVDVMALCQKSVGARGLNKPHHFERIIRDLSTYLRQPAPDAALADVGRYVLKNTIPTSELWATQTNTKIL